MNLFRIWLFLFLIVFTQLSFAAYPDRPVRIILPYAAGGGADVLTRVLAESLSKIWKQSVVVDNRPGAGATIGTDMVAKATPDGYTLLMTANTMAVSPAAYPKLPYDVIRDFAPITMVAQSPYMLAINSNLPIQNASDFFKLAKSQPGKLNYGSPGNGTLSHLTFELMSARSGIRSATVPYKGSNPALMAVLSGEIDFVLDTPAAVMQHVSTQRLRVLGVTSAARSQIAPQVPSLQETGFADLDVTVWFGLLAPANVPQEVIRKVYADVITSLNEPAVRQRLSKEGLDVVTMPPDVFANQLKNEVAKWGDIVKKANIKFD